MGKILMNIFLIVITVSDVCGQQRFNDINSMDTIGEKFMSHFSRGEINTAISIIERYSVIEAKKLDELADFTKKQMEFLPIVFGKTVGYEFVCTKSVKQVLARKYYLLKFEKMCLKFVFTFYNNGDGWTITNFTFNEDLEDLF